MNRNGTQVTLTDQIRALPLEERVALCLRDHEPAIELYKALYDVTQVWGSLTTSHAAPADDVNRAMYAALVEIPSNPFFRQHADALLPVLANAVVNWLGSQELEKSGDPNLQAVAYTTRADHANLLLQMAMLIGGPGWGCQVAPLVRGCWNDEPFDSYMSRMAPERKAEPAPNAEVA